MTRFTEVCYHSMNNRTLLSDVFLDDNIPKDDVPEMCNSNASDSEAKEESKTNTDTHVESANKKTTLTCEQCGKKFFKSHRLEGHLRQHQGLKVRSVIVFISECVFNGLILFLAVCL